MGCSHIRHACWCRGMCSNLAGLAQGVVDRGKTPQGSNGSPQVSAQETASAGGAAKAPALPALSTAMAPSDAQPSAATSASAHKALSLRPASPSPTASKENEALQAPSAGKAEEVAGNAGFCAHEKVLEAPEGHAVALKACASETAAREPMLSPTRVLLKG